MAAWVLARALDALSPAAGRALHGAVRTARAGEPPRSSAGTRSAASCASRSTTTASSASSRATSGSRSSTGTATASQYGDIQRLDRILEAEGDTPNRYKASKQADVLMLFYLFSADELRAALRAAGLPVRARHASQEHRLLPRPHLARLDTEPGRPLLGAGALRPAALLASVPRRRCDSDVADIQGGTTPRASIWARWPAPST